jgi:DNA invertase Pin-like site-specific DNA recombinase
MEERPLRTGVSYGRESVGKKKSVDDQLAANREEAERLGVELLDEVSDGSSASRFATKVRKNWAEILKWVPKVDVVMLWEPSRGDRDLETWVAFVARCRDNGTRIHATGYHDTYDPRNPRHWRALMEDGVDASYETEKMSLRIRRGVATAAVAGRPYGPTVYGYRRLHDERTGELTGQVPDEDTAPIVEEIVSRIARAEPLRAVAVDLNARGIVSPQGKQWAPATIRGLCRHAEYLGQRAHRGKLYSAMWPAIVEEEDWHAANRVLDNPARRNHLRPGAVKWLMSGLIECQGCADGGPVGVSLSGRYKNPRYKCRTCSGVNIDVAQVDEYMSRLVVARMLNKDLRAVFTPNDTATKQAQAELDRRPPLLRAGRGRYHGRIPRRNRTSASTEDRRRPETSRAIRGEYGHHRPVRGRPGGW